MGNILIVDDSPFDRKMIRQVLERRIPDVNVFEADNGLDIAYKLSKNHIHVCILDIIMPNKDGYEVLTEMKNDQEYMDIPVIVCTGTEDKQAIEKALTLGAYDYFSKPLSEEAMKISMPLKVKNATELMKRKEEIIYLSYHDKLTGLYNRRFCEKEIKRLDTERNLPISLIIGDVNGLKLTNDAFGHQAGDKLLISIANIIKNECRGDEIVARFGGDEFLIVLPKTDRSGAEKITERIKVKCDKEEGDPVKYSISMGFDTKEHNDQDIFRIYKTAEDNMYNKKILDSRNVRSAFLGAIRKTLQEQSYDNQEHRYRLLELCEKIEKLYDIE